MITLTRQNASFIVLLGISTVLASCAGRRGPLPVESPPVLSTPGANEADVIRAPQARTNRDRSNTDRVERTAAIAGAVAPPARAVSRWTTYKQFLFAPDQADVPTTDSRVVSEIVSYMARNPSLRLGIDGSDTRDPALAARRVAAVREALIKGGVESARIETGAFSSSRLLRDRKVEVLLINR